MDNDILLLGRGGGLDGERDTLPIHLFLLGQSMLFDPPFLDCLKTTEHSFATPPVRQECFGRRVICYL
jgi:hypothetical protein